MDEAHFGGFMTKTDDDFKGGRANTRKEFIDNLIKVGFQVNVKLTQTETFLYHVANVTVSLNGTEGGMEAGRQWNNSLIEMLIAIKR